MDNRGFAFIERQDGKKEHYELKGDGKSFFFAGQRVASDRNWMLGEKKAKEIFRRRIEVLKSQGLFKDSYSSMWTESQSSGHTYSYVKKPKAVTSLKKYGTHEYNLGFEVHKNFKFDRGKWDYDTIYYVIDWYPTEPVAIQITKTHYKNGSKVSKVNLSKKVQVTDKAKVRELITKFRDIYKHHKNTQKG